MIVRNVNVNDLSHFDFFNDSADTISWLRMMERLEEAETLRRSAKICFLQRQKQCLSKAG